MSANQATIVLFALALASGAVSAAAQSADGPGDGPPSAQAVIGLNRLTIGMLATVQSQTLTAEAAKRIGMLGSTTPPPLPVSAAPVVAISPKPVAPPREARLVAIVAKQGQLLFTEWEEDGEMFQRHVGELVLGWTLNEADLAGLRVTRGTETRSLTVGAKVRNSKTESNGGRRQ